MDRKFCVWELKRKLDRKIETIALPRGITTIGRGLQNQVKCLSTLASRNHCQIKLLDNGLIFIRDLKSLNGVHLASQRILSERDVSLSHDDVIGIGVDPSDLGPLTEMCIFNLCQIALGKDEVEARKIHGCVVPFNSLYSEDLPSSNQTDHDFARVVQLEPSVSINRTDHDCASAVQPEPIVSMIQTDHDFASVVKPEPMNQTDIDTKYDVMGNGNIVDCGLSKGVMSESDVQHSKTEIDRQFIDHIQPSSSRVGKQILDNDIKSIDLIHDDDVQFIDHIQPSSSCVGKQILDNDIKSIDLIHEDDVQFIDLIQPSTSHVGKKTLDYDIKSIDLIQPPSSDVGKKSLDNDFKLVDYIQPPSTHVGKKTLDSDLKLVDYIRPPSSHVGKKTLENDVQSIDLIQPPFLLVGEKTLQNDLKLVDYTQPPSLHVGKQILENDLQSIETNHPSTSRVGKKTLENDLKLVDYIQPPSSHVGIQILENDLQSIETNQTSTSRIGIKTLDNNLQLVDYLQPSTSRVGIKTLDNNLQLVDYIPPSTSRKETLDDDSYDRPSLSESFTMADDIIIIDDDELLPCSQMFDMKHELKYDPAVEDSIPLIDISDEEDISDADSSDEWFQRLSQCDSEMKFPVDHAQISENYSADIFQNKENELKGFEREFQSENKIQLEPSTSNVTPIEYSEQKKRKHDSNESSAVNEIPTIDGLDNHLFSKKFKQSTSNNTPTHAVVKNNARKRRHSHKHKSSYKDDNLPVRRKSEDSNLKSSSKTQSGEQNILNSYDNTLDNFQHQKNNKVARRHEEDLVDSLRIIQESDKDGNEGYAIEQCVEDSRKSFAKNTSEVNQDKSQRQENLKLTIAMDPITAGYYVNTRKSSEIIQMSNKSSEEAKLLHKNHLSCQETKLDAIQEKISKKYAKKPTPVVGAIALPVKKKQLYSPDDTLNQNTEHSHNVRKASKSKPFLSKKPQSIALPLSAEEKAYRKLKLSEIASKTIKEQTSTTEKKPVKTLKTVKNTQKSRTEMFIDNLVSLDNKTSKEKKSADNNVESKKKRSTIQYKIPKRNVQHDKMENETLRGAENNQVDKTLNGADERDLVKTDAKCKGIKVIKPKDNKIDYSSKEIKDCNKLNGPAVSHCEKMDTTPKTLHSGIEYMEFNGEIQPKKSRISRVKSITKESEPISGKRKRVRFSKSDDDNLIVSTRYFDIEEGSTLKPLIFIGKKDRPPPRKECNRANQMPSLSYFDENLHHICSWNTVWFQEKDKCMGEPPAFKGQIYHMKDSFINFFDYRRSIFPLMLHELWAVMSRQHDQIQNKNKPFIINIKHVSIKPITHMFNPMLQEGEKKTLCCLDCQILLEKSDQPMWPRTSDLVVLDVRLSLTGKFVKRRILGYIVSSNVRPIARSVVSPKLRAQNANATLVMDLSMYIKEERYQIDTTQESRVAVLKNIRPELRLFNAMDSLATSPMLKAICEPSAINLEIPPSDIGRAIHKTSGHLNPSQKKAVTNVAGACLTNDHMIHFIHGPPGCGKSEVIISIIETLFLAHKKTNPSERLQILLCAPSNAAVDDIFLRLMEHRNKYKKSDVRINMVRIGKTDFMHSNVRTMTLDYLVERDIKNNKSLFEDEQSRLLELKTLEAKMNLLNYQLENPGIKKNNANYIKNVEMKLAETIRAMKELETGKGKKTYEGKELKEKTKERELLFLGGANVIASTLSSCYNPQMEAAYLNNRLRFTCCIVDEATQCTEPDLLIPLMLGVRQLVLVGDPLQLPATVISSTAKEHGLDRSLFARHRDWWLRNSPSNKLPTSRYHLLDTQYRMHPEIAKWPSQHFYNSSIKNHESVVARSHPLLPYVILSHCFSQSNREESNHEEVTLVERLVQAIDESGLCKDKSIGIITPYNHQRNLLRRRLDPGVEVGTVDSFQGRERDIIIMSCVRTEGVGFMSGTERLNVALTRARHSLIICANFKSLEADVTWASLLKDAKVRGIFRTVPKSYRSDNLLQAIIKK